MPTRRRHSFHVVRRNHLHGRIATYLTRLWLAFQAACCCLVVFTVGSCVVAILNHYLVGSRVLGINAVPATWLDELGYWIYHYGPPAALAASVPLAVASVATWRLDPARFSLVFLSLGVAAGLVAGWRWELMLIQGGAWNGVAWNYVVSPWVAMLVSLLGYLISAGLAARRARLRQGCCPQCGYSLGGSPSAICPECGLHQASRGPRSA